MFKENLLCFHAENVPERQNKLDSLFKVATSEQRTKVFGDILKENKGRLDQYSLEKALAYVEEELKHRDKVSVRKNATLNVLMIQSLLAQAGYDPGELDDAWGNNTSKALENFKTDASINEKGFGLLTLNAFKKKFKMQDSVKKREKIKPKIYNNEDLDHLKSEAEVGKNYISTQEIKLKQARIDQGFYFDKKGNLKNKYNSHGQYSVLTDGESIILDLPGGGFMYV
ncbi:MAG: hypothetical protein WC806_04430 [Candidatus Gracilibacteria bacterium]|jgi:peptidoglycan hydrolase-like protein with peptidoglycan-binding domain